MEEDEVGGKGQIPLATNAMGRRSLASAMKYTEEHVAPGNCHDGIYVMSQTPYQRQQYNPQL